MRYNDVCTNFFAILPNVFNLPDRKVKVFLSGTFFIWEKEVSFILEEFILGFNLSFLYSRYALELEYKAVERNPALDRRPNEVEKWLICSWLINVIQNGIHKNHNFLS